MTEAKGYMTEAKRLYQAYLPPAEGRKDTQRKIIGCVASPGELLLVIDEHRETFALSRHMAIALIETLARSLS